MLICEHHPPVYTVGLREKNTEEIKHELIALGAEFVKVSSITLAPPTSIDHVYI